MKKMIFVLLAVLALPSYASAQPGVGESHSLDKVARTSISVGLGAAGIGVKFGDGYDLHPNSEGGFLVGYALGISHRLDLTENYSLRIAGDAYGVENLSFEGGARSQDRYSLDGTWIWKFVSPLTLDASAGIEYNKLRFESQPNRSTEGDRYGGSNYLRLRPAIGVGVQPEFFVLRLEVASPHILSAGAVPPFYEDGDRDLDWSIADRRIAFEFVAEIGFILAEVLEVGIEVTRSSWSVTYERPEGTPVTVSNETVSSMFEVALRF